MQVPAVYLVSFFIFVSFSNFVISCPTCVCVCSLLLCNRLEADVFFMFGALFPLMLFPVLQSPSKFEQSLVTLKRPWPHLHVSLCICIRVQESLNCDTQALSSPTLIYFLSILLTFAFFFLPLSGSFSSLPLSRLALSCVAISLPTDFGWVTHYVWYHRPHPPDLSFSSPPPSPSADAPPSLLSA